LSTAALHAEILDLLTTLGPGRTTAIRGWHCAEVDNRKCLRLVQKAFGRANERLKQHTNCLSIVKISPKRKKHARVLGNYSRCLKRLDLWRACELPNQSAFL